MGYILKLFIVNTTIFSLVSCKENKTREEGERRIKDSEITIYSNKDLRDLSIGDFIYADFTQKSIENHKGFFSDYYSPIIINIISGLRRLECRDIFSEKTQCYQITSENIEFSYIMVGSFYRTRGGILIHGRPQTIQSEIKTYKFSLSLYR
ncbi:hypothetical protein [Fluviispira vulneris]|uniref:hypothetical protein n=1 Tax=Fluviispira vulneris TaxID=2763012 RepID=UPI001648601E|nr:hypothetical protein [Fluviispira vulneris]